MPEIVDLDVLRPPPKIMRLGGNDIDVSYIPTALTFEVSRITQELSGLDVDEMAKGEDAAQRGFNMMVELCALYCSWKHPEMTVEWIMDNTNAAQVNAMSECIQKTLEQAFAGAETGQKK